MQELGYNWDIIMTMIRAGHSLLMYRRHPDNAMIKGSVSKVKSPGKGSLLMTRLVIPGA